MGCKGKVDFEKLMAATMDLDGNSSRLLFEYFRLVSSLKRRKISPTLEYLCKRLRFTEKQIRTANMKLKKAGWIDRQWAIERADKRAMTNLLKYDAFLHTGADERADKRATDVVVSSMGVTGVSSGVDVVVDSSVKEVLKILPVPNSAPAVPLPRPSKPRKNPGKDLPGWANLKKHIPAEFERVVKSPYSLTVVELAMINRKARLYGAPQMAALWNQFMVMDDPWVRQTGRTVKIFIAKIPKLLEDESYKIEAKKIEKQWFPQAEDEINKVMSLINRGLKDSGLMPASKILAGFGGKEPYGQCP